MTNTNELNIVAHADDFFEMKTFLGSMIRRIEYPEFMDPSYRLIAEVPDEKMSIISDGIKAIQRRERR